MELGPTAVFVLDTWTTITLYAYISRYRVVQRADMSDHILSYLHHAVMEQQLKHRQSKSACSIDV